MKNSKPTKEESSRENCVYHSMKEFQDKFLSESPLNNIVSTDEEAQKLGAQLARESISNVKFDSLLTV